MMLIEELADLLARDKLSLRVYRGGDDAWCAQLLRAGVPVGFGSGKGPLAAIEVAAEDHRRSGGGS